MKKQRTRKLLIVVIVLIIYFGFVGYLWQKKQQEIRSGATAATSIFFTPSSTQATPLSKNVSDTFSLDVMLMPGTNYVSFLELDVQYDPTKLTLDQTSPIALNTQAFPQTLEGPAITQGQLRIKVGIGSDPTRAIQQVTKIATLQFKALAPTGGSATVIKIGNQTTALSISASDQSTENILASTTPVFVTIGGSGPTVTPLPSLTPLACNQTTASADLMLLLDSSGSMNAKANTNDATTKFASAQGAAKLFVDQFNTSPDVRIGLRSFTSTQATMVQVVDQALTADKPTVKTAIDKLKTSDGGTCLECAIKQAEAHLAAAYRPGVKLAFVLLTDGKANATVAKPFRTDSDPGTVAAEKAASDAVAAIYARYKPTIYVVGLGSDVNTDFLKQIAITTGGKYYFPLSSDDLNAIYADISKSIAKGSVSGTVFHDANTNALFDATEAKLSGWTVQAIDPVNRAVYARVTSGSQGDYILDNLCNGNSYQIEILNQSGWLQTTPKNPSTYLVPISKASVVAGKNFGMNESPKTIVSYTVFLHGIGNSGDNTNPDKFDFSNKSPKNPQKPIEISLYDSNDELATTLTGTMDYASPSGKFTGSVELNNGNISNANYIVRVASERHLRKRVEDLQTITIGKTNILTPVTLTTGDTDNNNKLNILDYNMIIGCYHDTSPAKNCTPTQQVRADTDDDGKVNQTDYNLFLRELTVQNGD